MSGPSKHLSWKELACKDGTPYPEYSDDRVYRLARVFEIIRSHFGDKPIVIHSAYRTKTHNKKIGGAKGSQHLVGKALDLGPPKGVGIKRFYDEILANRKDWGIGGIGKYNTFVHVDIRDGNANWSGSSKKDFNTLNKPS